MHKLRIPLAATSIFIALGILLAVTAASHGVGPLAATTTPPTGNSGAFPEGGSVSYPVVLPDASDHVGPIALDASRQGLWFGTSSNGLDSLNYFSFRARTLISYTSPITEPTAFIRGGIAIAGDGSVWASFGSSLARWDPNTRVVSEIPIPAIPPALVLNTPLPDELKAHPALTGVVADRQGSVWVGLQGIHALLTIAVSPQGLPHYVELPPSVGDVWSGQLEIGGSILWITGFSLSKPGTLESSVVRLNPASVQFSVIDQPAQAIASDVDGGFYVTVGEQVTHVDATGGSAHAMVKALSDAIAVDGRNGQLWFQDQTKSAFDRLDSKSGTTEQFSYPVVQYVPHTVGAGRGSPAIVVRPHISNMVVDDLGNLWFSVRGGSQIGEVSPNH